MADAIQTVNAWVWGPAMLGLLLGTGLYLSLGLRFMTLRRIPAGFRLLFRGSTGRGQGDISPFSALMTSLSATIGTGNIAGVATAIALGGPGALFWMWMTALVGMATKYAEAVCAVRFRERDAQGNFSGGPMYYIRNGMGKKWAWLGGLFASFGILAGWGTGASIQANS
ncbi:MAG: sodium:alanine symporter family protein, partial [Halioglobus sp.]|nr:sodium:alanine symporter family protein [Halioglobus sp.]